jgi:hypothetical protein
MGTLLPRLVRTWVWTQTCLRRQKGSLINSLKHVSSPLLGWSHVFQVQGVGSKYCAVWKCKITSLSRSPAMRWVWSPDSWSMANSNGLGWALTGSLVWGLYRLITTKRCLNPCERSGQRWTKWMVLFVFSCVSERRTSYLLSTALFPSVSVSVLLSGKWKEGEGVRVRTPL